MATSINQSILQDPPEEGLDELYEEVLAGFSKPAEFIEEPEIASPYSDIHDPTGLFYAEHSSTWSNQPASPSSVNTSGLTGYAKK